MKPRKIWANLSAEDMERTKGFYPRFGFKLNGNTSKELVSFLFGDDGFVIHFFETTKPETSLEGKTADPGQGNEVMF